MLFYLGQDFLANDPLIFRINQEVSVGQQIYVQIRRFKQRPYQGALSCLARPKQKETFCLDRIYLSFKFNSKNLR